MDCLEIDIALPRRHFELRAALRIEQGTLVLIGPSGAGKTSLLRAVAGLDRPRAGVIALGSELWFDAESGVHVSAERRHVGYLPQDYGLFPHLTVAGNVRFADRRDRPDLLERLAIAHLAAAHPRELSGGERQRVALARALARSPRVLLLDEPFGALDAVTRRSVRDELAPLLAELALPTLLVTHSFEDASTLGNRIGVIDHGRIAQVASPAELVSEPATAVVAALTGANVLDGRASGATVELADGGRLATATESEGPVRVAIHPWELQPAPVESSQLSDRVVSVRQDRGRLVVRLTRFTIELNSASGSRHVPAGALAEGGVIGLTAAPESVHVFPSGG